MKTNNKLVREQLQMTLAKLRPLLDSSIPPKGWIKAIKNALGMSGRQFAERMGVTKQRASFMEKQEIDGTTTFKAMRKTAEALDCVFVYGFVPRTSLEETIRNRAKQLANKRIARASHTMGLENQALSKKENKKILSNMIKDIMDELPSNLWDK